MKMTTVVPDAKQQQLIAERGEFLLKAFHDEYEKDPKGRETEFWRGQFTCWRNMLNIFYGESVAEEMTEAVSEKTRLSIPHGGAEYICWDSGSHTFIGKLE